MTCLKKTTRHAMSMTAAALRSGVAFAVSTARNLAAGTIDQWWCGVRYKHTPSFIHITGDGHQHGHTFVEAETRCVRCKHVTARTVGVDHL